MNIAVLMNDNAYAGREYLDCLEKAQISVDVIIFGKYPIKDAFEDKRCSGLWNPKKISQKKLISNEEFKTKVEVLRKKV